VKKYWKQQTLSAAQFVVLKIIQPFPDILKNHFLSRNICIGLIDGITIPLALAAGLSNLVDSSTTIIIACMAAGVAGSLTMSFGGFVESRKYDPERKPLSSAITIGVSYLIGGLIVSFPYFFIAIPMKALQWSAGISLAELLIAGYYESSLNGSNGIQGSLRVFFTGAVAAGAAFLVAKLFV
jgi:VIT1/CCC1 family predicted Fe2+/Mn2+ transporter